MIDDGDDFDLGESDAIKFQKTHKDVSAGTSSFQDVIKPDIQGINV
jgi:hypothetical protein